jgi:predicted hotdog family 3-hydroxylacyl-ACP dehydratase
MLEAGPQGHSTANRGRAVNKTIPVQDIWDLVPHRPPMVWVDEVLEYSATGGKTRIVLKAGEHYMDERGRMRPSSCLEFCAQSYAFISICYRAFSGNPVNEAPKRAFLAAFNDAKMAAPEIFERLKTGDELQAEITGARAMGPIVLFQGRVTHGADVL